VTVRGEQTRQHLLDVAERLFGERGYQAVSLREIRIAAGARNTAAMQFHFGDRDGLVDALMARHMPRIAEIQQRLYDRMIAEGREQDARSLVEVLVRPAAEYLTWGRAERSWVKVMGELSSMPQLHGYEMRSAAPAPGLEVGSRLYERLCTVMPRRLAARRMVLLAQSAVQICADRARLFDADPAESATGLPMPVFIENLTDMIQGSLFAPVSPATARALEVAVQVEDQRSGDATDRRNADPIDGTVTAPR
jgi:AcrR family transcriptional regulator